jgi:hypothetical protein
MSQQSATVEQRILVAMRKVLARVVKDTTPPPGMRNPLSDGTIQDIRQCLALIAARERELHEAQGRTRSPRPFYVDESPGTGNVVSIDELTKKK